MEIKKVSFILIGVGGGVCVLGALAAACGGIALTHTQLQHPVNAWGNSLLECLGKRGAYGMAIGGGALGFVSLVVVLGGVRLYRQGGVIKSQEASSEPSSRSSASEGEMARGRAASLSATSSETSVREDPLPFPDGFPSEGVSSKTKGTKATLLHPRPPLPKAAPSSEEDALPLRTPSPPPAPPVLPRVSPPLPKAAPSSEEDAPLPAPPVRPLSCSPPAGDIIAGEETPLHWAIACEPASLPKILQGMDPARVRAGYVKTGDPSKGRTTALHLACTYGDLSAVTALAEKGACVNALDEFGRTPLHIVACKGNGSPFIERLLQKGAQLTALDSEGRTPLWAAVEAINLDGMLQCIRYDIWDQTLHNRAGQTVEEYLESRAKGSGSARNALDVLQAERPNLKKYKERTLAALIPDSPLARCRCGECPPPPIHTRPLQDASSRSEESF